MEGSDLVAAELESKRQRGIKTALLLAAMVVILRYLPLTSNLFFFSVVENFAYDLAFDYRPVQVPANIAIVAIDDASLKIQGQFPWPRDVYARLLDKLPTARVVAFDVLFIEPDRANSQGDKIFAQALRRHGRVVLGAYKQERSEVGGGEVGALPNYPLPGGNPGPLQAIQALNFRGPVPILAQAAAGLGYVDIEPDADGVHRRVEPLRVGYDGRIYPHFAMEVARVATGASPDSLVADLAPGRLDLPARAVPLSSRGAMLINYAGPVGTVPTYSFQAVLDGKVPAEQLRDQIILVGATAPGLYDIRPAPFRTASRKFFGVETNANIVNSLLDRPPLRDASRSLAWLALALLIGAGAGLLVWSGGETLGPLLGVLLLVLVALPSFFVGFFLLHTIVPYGALIWATLLPVAVGALERMGAERRMIKDQFGTYVSPEVLDRLMHDPDLVRHGQRRTVTLLFSDVRGSTGLTEKATPEAWLAQLNEYLTAMSAAIFEYDGYLDKFMGDGIMAVWNPFGNQPDHAELALGAAHRMLELLELLNQHWEEAEERTPFHIGIGLHSGEALVGNVGSDQRTQYTAIGDPVNTAARLEAMNKQYGTELLVSEATAALLKEDYPLREIGEVEVRGRARKLRIFEVRHEEQAAEEAEEESAPA